MRSNSHMYFKIFKIIIKKPWKQLNGNRKSENHRKQRINNKKRNRQICSRAGFCSQFSEIGTDGAEL